MSSNLLEVRNLAVTIATSRGPLHAVRGVSFDVAAGETVCLVGESGCGKSMTALSLMRLLPRGATISASRLALAGDDLLTASDKTINALRGNRMAMIFQEPMTALNPAWTVGSQLIEVYRRHKGAARHEARAKAVSLLDRVGIARAADRLEVYPHQLSGGLRQRIMIAMALMCDPALLIADEPTTALDVTIQAQILALLAELQKDIGIALLLITHDLGVVARIADRVNVMYAGRIVEHADVAALFGAPAHPYTRGLLSCLPRPGSNDGERLGTIAGVVPSLVGGMAGCAFRARCPEAMPGCAGDIPIRNLGTGHEIECVCERATAAA